MKNWLWNVFVVLAIVGGSFFPGVGAVSVAEAAVHPAGAYTDPDTLIAQIMDTLAQQSLVQDREAQVLDVIIEGEAIIINWDRRILDEDAFDAEIFARLTQALDAQLELTQRYFVTFQIEGRSLDDWGMPVPEFPTPAEAPRELQAPAAGPLSGKKIALNPGHGLYDKTDNGAYSWQRGEWWGIREDLVNAEMIMYAAQYFENAGATVIDLRQMDKSPTGPSGYPHWYEGAREYLWDAGLPSWVWNTSGCGSNNLCKDIMARPYGANYYGAHLLINLHNNGGQGTGTETWYDTTGDYHSSSAAQNLAQKINSRVVNTIRARYNSSWTDRGVKPSNGGYGENRYARMPAALIEVAFMDKESPDNDALHDEAFKRLVAEALVLGVCDYYGVACSNVTQPPTLTPAAPSNLSAASASSTQIDLTWNDNSDNESGFKIERSPNGSSDWTQITTVGAGVTSHSNSGLSDDTPYYYRVRAYNSHGNSGYSNVASATTGSPPPASGTKHGSTNKDAYAESGYPDIPTGNQQNMYLGYDTWYGKGYNRIYIKFNLPSLPSGATVSSAQVELYQYAVQCSGSYGVTAYEITSDWGQYELTWNNQPSKGGSVGSTSFECSTGWKTVDITNLVSQWYQGRSNHGVTVWANNESAAGGVFRSKDCTTSQCPNQEHPRIRVSYTVPSPEGLGSIAGRVTDDDGAPMVDVRVTLNTGPHTRTDGSGEYLFTDLEDGSYTITPEKDYYHFSPAQRTANVTSDVTGQNFTGGLPDLGFRPHPDGYSFNNYGGVNYSDYTIGDMRRMFGDDAVCWMVFGVCVPKPAAVAWNAQANDTMAGGHCDGMASTSLLFFKGFGDPEDFQSGASVTYDLDHANARRNIAYYFVEQLTNPVRSYKARSVQNSPREILRQLSAALGSGADPTTLIVRQRQSNGRMSGHAITPYAIEDRGGGVYWIRVYDNNTSGNTSRYVVVDTVRNTWSYQIGANTTWQGDAGTKTLGLVPISNYRADPECPWCSSNRRAIGSFPYEGVWLDGAGHLLISDSRERMVGYVGDKLVNDFGAEAVSIIDAGSDVALEPLYTVPLSDTYTMLLDGQTVDAPETVSLAFFGEGNAVRVEDLVLDAATRDRVAISPDGNQIAYQASRDQEATLTLMLEEASESGLFTIRGADVISGQMVALGVDTERQYLVYTNEQDEAGTYNVDIKIVGTEGDAQFMHTNLNIAPLDTHYLDYGAWDRAGDMTLYIDNDQDGAADETMTLANQSNLLFLPLVVKD
ncbi:MAG: DNRLRE domain-containing protein [Anaerolineales bacterium]